MIHALYTLKKELWNKKVYIWNINRDSVMVFTKAIFSRINIQGFVTLQKEYVGEKFFNLPIIYAEQIGYEQDSVVLVADGVPEDIKNEIQAGQVIYWSEALSINPQLYQKKIIVYGTGHGAEHLCEVLDRVGIEVELFCVTKLDHVKQYRNKEIIEAGRLGEYKEYEIILSVEKKRFIEEILELINDFCDTIYLDLARLITIPDMVHLNIAQSIDQAYKKDKKIYLYGKKNAVAALIEDVIKPYDIKISGYAGELQDIEQGIESIYKLGYSGTEDKLIILHGICPENILQDRECVELAGFSLEQGNYTGLDWLLRADENVVLERYHNDTDLLVGGSILYPDGKLGWKIYGTEKQAGIKIMIVGGSTSSEAYMPENWISKLYYKISANNIRTTIYNGAHTGNDIVIELLRILRDVHILQPQIVISMSGVNNLYYKTNENWFSIERFVGVWSRNGNKDAGGNETLYSFWSKNMKLMRCIANTYGAQFFGFLQPMNMTIDDMSLHEKTVYEMDGRNVGAKEFSQWASDEDGYVNLLRLFENQDEMFFDLCHYTEKGHEVIADKVYETIKPTIMELIKEDNALGYYLTV